MGRSPGSHDVGSLSIYFSTWDGALVSLHMRRFTNLKMSHQHFLHCVPTPVQQITTHLEKRSRLPTKAASLPALRASSLSAAERLPTGVTDVCVSSTLQASSDAKIHQRPLCQFDLTATSHGCNHVGHNRGEPAFAPDVGCRDGSRYVEG